MGLLDIIHEYIRLRFVHGFRADFLFRLGPLYSFIADGSDYEHIAMLHWPCGLQLH